jgi:hypothetical protein
MAEKKAVEKLNGPAPIRGPRPHVRLIVWYKGCRHQTEPDPAGQAERHPTLIPSEIFFSRTYVPPKIF